MFDVRMTSEWMTWISALAAPLQARSRVRLAPLFLGMTFAAGRRTASAWWRAIGVGTDFRSCYYFLAALGRNHQAIAAALLKIVIETIDTGDKLLFGIRRLAHETLRASCPGRWRASQYHPRARRKPLPFRPFVGRSGPDRPPRPRHEAPPRRQAHAHRSRPTCPAPPAQHPSGGGTTPRHASQRL